VEGILLSRHDERMHLTFNPGAIPVAVLSIAFGAFATWKREWIVDAADRFEGRVPSRRSRTIRIRLLPLVSVWSLLVAAFVLFYDFT
jgi:hypothetical protein